jgi:hypothetical protein
MPIDRMLGNLAFTPEETTMLSTVYDEVLTSMSEATHLALGNYCSSDHQTRGDRGA